MDKSCSSISIVKRSVVDVITDEPATWKKVHFETRQTGFLYIPKMLAPAYHYRLPWACCIKKMSYWLLKIATLDNGYYLIIAFCPRKLHGHNSSAITLVWDFVEVQEFIPICSKRECKATCIALGVCVWLSTHEWGSMHKGVPGAGCGARMLHGAGLKIARRHRSALQRTAEALGAP